MMISFASHFSTGVGGQQGFRNDLISKSLQWGGGRAQGFREMVSFPRQFSKYFHFRGTPRGRWEGEGGSIKISILLTSFKNLIRPGRGVGTREARGSGVVYQGTFRWYTVVPSDPEISNVCRYGTVLGQRRQKCRRSRGHRVVNILG
jgi:hypothetical protein